MPFKSVEMWKCAFQSHCFNGFGFICVTLMRSQGQTWVEGPDENDSAKFEVQYSKIAHCTKSENGSLSLATAEFYLKPA